MSKNKVPKHYLKYVLIDKKEGKARIFHYKTQLSDVIGVSVRTLDRNMPYKDDNYEVYKVENNGIVV